MPETFILIPGRTSRQGCGISEGKFNKSTRKRRTSCRSRRKIWSGWGCRRATGFEFEARPARSKWPSRRPEAMNCPRAFLFIAYGDLSSRLLGADTHGSGIPTSKGLDVVLEKIG